MSCNPLDTSMIFLMNSIAFYIVGALLVSSVLGAPQMFNTDMGNKGGSHDTTNNNNVSPGSPPTASGGPVSGPVPTKPGAPAATGNPNVPNIPSILAKSQAQVQKSQALIEKMGLNKKAPATPPQGGEAGPGPNHPPPTGAAATGSGPSFTTDTGNVDGDHKTTNNNKAPGGVVPSVAPAGPGPIPAEPKGPAVDPIPPISPNPAASSGGDFNSDVGNIDGDHKTMNNNHAGGSPAPVEPIHDPVPPIAPAPTPAPKEAPTGGATFNTDIGNEGGDHKTENNNHM
ncbi:unnamed protein product [Orchesella dallaii]|uniref:Uncharacterized protein n=1 Tax=Orchesella dallaii TaxID=48710 RepID=A0ABP1S7C6_9HEXA